jgi:hypothetical protein
MHRSSPKQSTRRVRIKARRADHPSHLTHGTKGADQASHPTLDTAGLLIKVTSFRYSVIRSGRRDLASAIGAVGAVQPGELPLLEAPQGTI